MSPKEKPIPAIPCFVRTETRKICAEDKNFATYSRFTKLLQESDEAEAVPAPLGSRGLHDQVQSKAQIYSVQSTELSNVVENESVVST